MDLMAARRGEEFPPSAFQQRSVAGSCLGPLEVCRALSQRAPYVHGTIG